MASYIILPRENDHDEYFFIDTDRNLFINSDKDKILIACCADDNWIPYTDAKHIKRMINCQDDVEKIIIKESCNIDWETSWINLDLWDKNLLYIDVQDSRRDSSTWSMCLDIGKYIADHDTSLANRLTDIVYQATKHPSYLETSHNAMNKLIIHDLNHE